MWRPAMRIELTAALRRGLQAVRRVAGMPDYAAYVEHRSRHHPGEPVATEREFYAEHVTARYTDSPTRCC